jgi:predicted Rossmann fold flavoprotein
MKVVVIGGGAAGFFGAIACAQLHPQCEVILLEKSNKVLSKVRISGGGRCNVTHACFHNSQLAKFYPRGSKTMLSTLSQFNAGDTVAWFETRGVKLKTEPDGRMFPVTNSSQTVIDCLLDEAKKAGVVIRTSTGVSSVEPLHQATNEPTRFELTLLNGEQIQCDKVLIATGGNPNAAAYEWLTFGKHSLEHPVPSLFTFNTPHSYLLDLSGVSVQETVVKVAGTKLQQTGPLLITHWGFSGPAVLKLSAWGARELHKLSYRFTLLVNWLPHYNEETLREELTLYKENNPKKMVAAMALFQLPSRLWLRLVEKSEIGTQARWAELPKKNLNKLIDLLTKGSFEVEGKSTYKDEFVTCGGIMLDNINPQTMESKYCRGLYFAGEVLDIDGVTGGFNFQNAWTSGYIAGKHIGTQQIKTA